LSQKPTTLEERKAEVLIKLRHYKLLKKQKHEEAIGYVVSIPREKQKALMWCIPEGTTVGINILNRLQKTMKEAEIEKGILITNGRYTHAVKQRSRASGKIELLPKDFPAFDLFEHRLVPKHEILTEKERSQLLVQYKVHPYQLPQISSVDPAVKAIGAKPGDVLRIIRKSQTAGEHITYRYVVE